MCCSEVRCRISEKIVIQNLNSSDSSLSITQKIVSQLPLIAILPATPHPRLPMLFRPLLCPMSDLRTHAHPAPRTRPSIKKGYDGLFVWIEWWCSPSNGICLGLNGLLCNQIVMGYYGIHDMTVTNSRIFWVGLKASRILKSSTYVILNGVAS